jgi:hypothetical protein
MMSPFLEVLKAFFKSLNSGYCYPEVLPRMRGRDALATAAGTAALQNLLFYRDPPLLAL